MIKTIIQSVQTRMVHKPEVRTLREFWHQHSRARVVELSPIPGMIGLGEIVIALEYFENGRWSVVGHLRVGRLSESLEVLRQATDHVIARKLV